MMTQEKKKVVLFYADDFDYTQVRPLYNKLTQEGFDLWFEEEDLLPGQAIRYEIRKAIRNACVLVVCLSQAAVSTPGRFQADIKEVLAAVEEQPEGTIFTVPVRLDECELPFWVMYRQLKHVDYWDERGYRRLLKSLKHACGDPIATSQGTPPTTEYASSSAAAQESAHAPDLTAEEIDADEIRNLQALRSRLKRVLHELQMQRATMGINTPPHITIQIEDTEREIADIDAKLKGKT